MQEMAQNGKGVQWGWLPGLAPACRNNRLKSCQHLHWKAVSQQHYRQQSPFFCSSSRAAVRPWNRQHAGLTASSYANISSRRLFRSSIISSDIPFLQQQPCCCAHIGHP